MKQRLIHILALGIALALASPLYATAPTVTAPSTESVYKGIAITPVQIVASNTPTSYAASPLPGGLTLNTTTGVISGTPTYPITSPVVTSVTATNTDGTSSAFTLTWTVNDTTYNTYTGVVTPTPTPAETPNGTPSQYPSHDPGTAGVGNVSIVGGIGGYIPNDPKTREGVRRLVNIWQGIGDPATSLGVQGDLYERLDGSTSTTLYVKTAPTVWTAK